MAQDNQSRVLRRAAEWIKHLIPGMWWRLIVVAITSLVVTGCLVPILTLLGIDPSTAEWVAGIAGALVLFVGAFLVPHSGEGSQAKMREQRKALSAAVERLGHEAAIVRARGIHELGRLADETQELKGEVVQEICMYLCQSFTPPGALLGESGGRLSDSLREVDVLPESSWKEELKIRIKAQNLITHLARPADNAMIRTAQPAGRASGVQLALRGATLVNFDLSHCHLDEVQLQGARFYGDTLVSGAQFHGAVNMQEAQFFGDLEEPDGYVSLTVPGPIFHNQVNLKMSYSTAESLLLGRTLAARST